MKNIVSFSILFITIFFNTSCLHDDTTSTSQPVVEYENLPTTYLFSNLDRMEEESSYYDALLDFRRSYPDYIQTINIVSATDQELVQYFEIEVYPTLVVIFDSRVEVRIEGFKDSWEIYSLLEASLSTMEDAS